MARSRIRKYLIFVFKLAISLALIAFLFHRAKSGNPEEFESLRSDPKDWTLLIVAWLSTFLAVLITFVRWMMLVRAVGLPFSLQDALRLGFLGYLFNFVSLGAVGGDLFKAFFIAREHPERKALAVSTVVIDRLVGLYGLFVVSSIAIASTGLYKQTEIPELRVIVIAALACFAFSTFWIVLLSLPGSTEWKISKRMEQMPLVGPPTKLLNETVSLYKKQYSVILIAIGLSLAVHCLITVAFYLISRGLPGDYPRFAQQFVAVPLSLLAAALPLPLSGLGALEGAIDYLYVFVGQESGVKQGKGLVVALVYRIVTLLIAAVGVCYYVSARKEISETLHEAEEEIEAGDGVASNGAAPE